MDDHPRFPHEAAAATLGPWDQLAKTTLQNGHQQKHDPRAEGLGYNPMSEEEDAHANLQMVYPKKDGFSASIWVA